MTVRRLVKHDDLDLTSIADPNAHGARHNVGAEDEIPDLASHASRHDRGGADPLDWAALSHFRKASGSGTIGVSGSPATIVELVVEANYYNLIPLEVDYDISGLATGETFTLHVTAVLDDGSEVTLANPSGLSAGGTLRAGDFDWSAIGDGRRVERIRVKFESSATSTSATGSATVVALQL